MSAVASVPDPMFPRPYRVHRVTKETSDTFTLELLPEAGHAGFAFAAGQFNMLYVCGIGEVPISISGDPGVPQALVHTTRAVGAVTKGMEGLRKGDSIGIRGPFGTNWPVSAAEGNDVVFVAGGRCDRRSTRSWPTATATAASSSSTARGRRRTSSTGSS